MSSSNFLQLTNMLLVRLKEPEITSSEFASVRGTSAAAKQCIKASVDEIYARNHEWPFMYQTGSQTATVGVEEYSFPTSVSPTNGVDWKSFRLQVSGALGINTTPLELIPHDKWAKDYRPADEDTSTSGLGIPRKVFKSHGTGSHGGFGISPSPNAAYVILYDYFVTETSLSLYSDSVTIPDRFDFVILNGALKNFYMFKENTEQAAFWAGEFDKTLNFMKLNLNPRRDDVYDTRVNFGGWHGR